MKKITLAFVSLLLVPVFAFAAHRHHHNPQPTPAPAPTPAPSPTPPPPAPSPVPQPTSVQLGSFNGSGETNIGTVTGIFIGSGDDFTQDVSGLHGTLVVYYEPSLTAQQIASGADDSSFLKWAAEMKNYNGQIILAVMDEMNLLENKYSGNPTAFKSAWVRIHALFTLDPNVQFAYDPNVSFPGVSASTFTAYYPGDSLVNLVGLDGFDFGGQTFSQVFSSSLAAMKTDFPSKPLWILSTGSVDNQPAFIQAEFSSGVKGIIFFDYQEFKLTSAALSALQTL